MGFLKVLACWRLILDRAIGSQLTHPLRSILALPPYRVLWCLEESAPNFWCWIGLWIKTHLWYYLPGERWCCPAPCSPFWGQIVFFRFWFVHGMSPGWGLKIGKLRCRVVVFFYIGGEFFFFFQIEAAFSFLILYLQKKKLIFAVQLSLNLLCDCSF